jgi:hypothetical protein
LCRIYAPYAARCKRTLRELSAGVWVTQKEAVRRPNQAVPAPKEAIGTTMLSYEQLNVVAIFTLSQRELWVLRVLFVISVGLGIGGYALSGGSLLEAVIGGGVLGGLSFIPVALLYLVYLFQRVIESVSAG